MIEQKLAGPNSVPQFYIAMDRDFKWFVLDRDHRRISEHDTEQEAIEAVKAKYSPEMQKHLFLDPTNLAEKKTVN
jgi:hypothetical protein